jgi:c-di-GMP-related signal transduction protein
LTGSAPAHNKRAETAGKLGVLVRFGRAARQRPSPFVRDVPIKQIVEVFVARQPIFDRQRKLYGYELLYRSAQSLHQFDGTEASAATKQVISNTLLSIGLDNILCGKKAFVNFDESLLSDGVYRSLPRESTVLEILESVEPDSDLLALCRSIHEQGYTIALDDFVASPEFEPLTDLAQLIKVDVRATARSEQQRLLRKYRPRGIALLAEKVETYEEFEWARKAGFDYFQGYFFARPTVIQSQHVPATKLNCLRLLTESQKPDLDFQRLEDLIRSDVALTYQLLRYVNSALFVSHSEIQSIKRALMLVGSDDFRRWVALATLPMLATDKPGELATLSVVRAKFCERLIELAGITQQNEAFLMGMFSLLDALIDQPLEKALLSVSLGTDITQALLGTAPAGNQLSEIYRLARLYEQGDWDQVEKITARCGFSASSAGNAYVEATLWAEQMLQAARR